MGHYCFEGIVHNSLCECNCLSCSAYRKAFFLEEFNRNLSKRIKETNEFLFLNIIKDKPARKVLIKELKKEFRPENKESENTVLLLWYRLYLSWYWSKLKKRIKQLIKK